MSGTKRKRSGRKRPLRYRVLTIVLLLLVPALVYWPIISGEFVFNDLWRLAQNPHAQNLNDFSILTDPEQYFTCSGELSYRPLVTAALGTLWNLSGTNTTVYHLVNILLHGFNAVLVFFLGLRLFSSDGGFQKALAAALLFALHPLHSEAVAALSYLDDTLSALFTLTAILLFPMPPASNHVNGGSGPGIALKAGLSAFCYTMALGAKESAIVFPVLVFGWSVFLRRKEDERSGIERIRFRSTVIRLLPHLLITAVYTWIRFIPFSSPDTAAYPGGSVVSGMLTWCGIFLRYLGRLLTLPDLSADHDPPVIQTFWSPAPLITLTLLAAAAILLLREPLSGRLWRRGWSYPLFWFLVTLAPVSGLVPLKFPEADRFLYLPSVGFLFAAVWLLWRLTTLANNGMGSGAPKRPEAAGTRKPVPFSLVIVILAVLLGFVTLDRVPVWADPLSLWQATAEDSPGSALAHNNLGLIHAKTGLLSEAEAEFRLALEINPDSAVTWNNLGNIYRRGERWDRAEESFQKSAGLDSGQIEARLSLGELHARRGRTESAESLFLEVRKIDPNDIRACLNLGRLLTRAGRNEEAAQLLEPWASGDTDSARLRVLLAEAYRGLREPERAIENLEAAIIIESDHVGALNNLGALYRENGDPENACRVLQRAIDLDPDGLPAYFNGALAWLDRGDADRAEQLIQNLLERNPENERAHRLLERIALFRGGG